MNIRDAAIKARKEGRGITRKSWGTRSTLILPTNTTAGFIGIEFKKEAPIQREWRPLEKDIIATDWYVYG